MGDRVRGTVAYLSVPRVSLLISVVPSMGYNVCLHPAGYKQALPPHALNHEVVLRVALAR